MRSKLPFSRLTLLALTLLGNLSAQVDRPNILFIFSDDHRHDLLGKANPLIQTPHLDALADSGVRFTHAFVTTAICSPSRAAVLSGRYGSRNGVPTLSGPLDFPEAAVPHALSEAGYRTIQVGKWHLGTTPSEAGFHQYARINSNGSWFQRNIDSNITGAPNKLNGTFYETVMADLVIDRISDHVSNHAQEPFFLWWCNQVPHVDGALVYRDLKIDPANKVEHKPPGSPGGYRNLYQVEAMPVPENWNDPLTTKPPYLASSRFVSKSVSENYGGVGGYTNPSPGVRNATKGEDNVQQHQLEYYAAITALDAEIGRVIARLEDPNGDGNPDDSITDNTWIIFMGDNGWQTGSHKFTSKVLAYEEACRVPLIIKAPGVAPRIENKFALNIDLTPMFHALAGSEIPGHLQGINLASLVKNTHMPWREHFYYEAVTPEPSLDAEPHDAIRTHSHKLIRTYNADGTAVVFEELYDLENDPLELNNLANTPASQPVKEELAELLQDRKENIASSPDPTRSAAGVLLENPSFDSGNKSGWTTNGSDTSTVVPSPLDGGSHAIQFNAGSSSSHIEQLPFAARDFTASWFFRFNDVITNRVGNVHARSKGLDRINGRISASREFEFNDGSDWVTPTHLTGVNSFEAGTTYLFTLTGTGWGDTTSTAPDAGSYTLSWIDLDDGSSDGSYSSLEQSNQGFRHAPPHTVSGGEFQGLRFTDDFGSDSDPAWLIDGVRVEVRSPLLSWAMEKGLTITEGALRVATGNPDKDSLVNAMEYAFDTDPLFPNSSPIRLFGLSLRADVRSSLPLEGFDFVFEYSSDLLEWTPRPDLIRFQASASEQFTQLEFEIPASPPTGFARARLSFPDSTP